VSEIERNLRLADGVLKYQRDLVRSDVEAAGVTIVDEEVKFERLELPPVEDDREDSRERQLGLIEPERAPRHEGGHDMMDDIEPDADGDKEDEEA
jgi:small subunit ribosomal protein S6